MDRYKFRGKRVDSGEWVDGDLMTKYVHHEGLTIVEGGCIYHHVDPASIGQFTGLHDKNGKRIWEGDIYKKSDNTYLVKFDLIGGFKWHLIYDAWVKSNALHKNFCSWLSPTDSSYIEIIGNKWDTPSLLEVTK